MQIWQKFLLRLGADGSESRPDQHLMTLSSTTDDKLNIDLSKNDLLAIAAWELNGREIQNVVRTTRLWCSYRKGRNFDLENVEAAIMVTAPFVEKEPTDDMELEEKDQGSTQARKRPRPS